MVLKFAILLLVVSQLVADIETKTDMINNIMFCKRDDGIGSHSIEVIKKFEIENLYSLLLNDVRKTCR